MMPQNTRPLQDGEIVKIGDWFYSWNAECTQLVWIQVEPGMGAMTYNSKTMVCMRREIKDQK